ncbi:hypothetical protein EDB19DRAFT_1919605 [Suillus lakei]|nr:hypothetical protein EDB19DRAFT_1919605 [Suillus lakei]
MLETTLRHLHSAHIRRVRTYELVIVNDGSKGDLSALALKSVQQHLKSDIQVIKLEKKLGKGGAVCCGMMHTCGNRLLVAGADAGWALLGPGAAMPEHGRP